MKLGVGTGYWGSGPPRGVEEALATAERLGFDSAWTSEAYGSDCLTPLAWWGSRTSTIRLGTSIAQLSARTPTATAMAAVTLDHLSGGRFILGLGASGPQVVEGWYGQPYAQPLARTREYVQIVRAVIERERPVVNGGQHYPLPLPGGTGLGKALKSTVHPLRSDLPIFLAAEGPRNVALSAEIADGWIPFWFSPKSDPFYREALADGFARREPHRAEAAFEVPVPIQLVPGNDVERAADRVRPVIALYVGGMGAPGANFHLDVFARMGWQDVCEEIQALYLAGEKEAAAAVVPLDMVRDVALIGTDDDIRAQLDAWRTTVATTLVISGPPEILELAHRLLSTVSSE